MAEMIVHLPDELAERVRRHVKTKGGNLDEFVSHSMAERLDELETTASVRRGLEDAAAGRIRPAREAIGKLANELGLTLNRPISHCPLDHQNALSLSRYSGRGQG